MSDRAVSMSGMTKGCNVLEAKAWSEKHLPGKTARDVKIMALGPDHPSLRSGPPRRTMRFVGLRGPVTDWMSFNV